MGNVFLKKGSNHQISIIQYFWFVHMFYIKSISKLVFFWVWLQEMYAEYMSITRKITKQQLHWFEQLIQRTCGPTLCNKKTLPTLQNFKLHSDAGVPPHTFFFTKIL